MSPRAAWRREAYGFQRVYDFVGGKLAWLAAGLPSEGEGPHYAVAGEALSDPTATCSPATPAGDVRRELQPGAESICAVTNDVGVVVGRVRWKDLPGDDGVSVENFMQLGPATVRPNEPLGPLVSRMEHAGVRTILVTSSKGQLLGVVHREDAKRAVARSPASPKS